MSNIHTRRFVAHSPDQMFDLVADVERYPEFVPYCQKHVVISRTNCGDSDVLITAMTVGHGRFSATIHSRDTLDRKRRIILIDGIAGGPLSQLRTVWTFQSRGNGTHCQVGFDSSYQFASPLLRIIFSGLFEMVSKALVQAFERRADAIYGVSDRSFGPQRPARAQSSDSRT
jgi:coenzyme Q-binding protein COQ10